MQREWDIRQYAAGLMVGLFLWSGHALAQPASTAVERIERGNIVTENVPPVPDAVRERLRQYQNVRPAGFVDWTQDGETLLISTRFAETAQFHTVTQPLGARSQITFYDEPARGGDWAPAGGPNGFLFTKDVGGAEVFRLHYFDADTGDVRILSEEGGRVEAYGWSDDGSKIMWSTTTTGSPVRKTYLASSDAMDAPETVFEREGLWVPAALSPDNQTLLMFNYISRNDSTLHALDLESGALTQINPSEDKISYGDVFFAKDGRALYYVSDEGSEFRRLTRYDLGDGEKTVLTENIPWDVEGVEQAPDGQHIAFTTNEGGLSKLHIRRVRGWRAVSGPDLAPGLISGLEFSPDSRKLAFTLNSASSPSDVYVFDIRPGLLTRWTKAEVGGLDTDRFVNPDLVAYPTFDEVEGAPREIPAFLFKPEDADGPLPVLISIHGGPESQYRPRFSSFTQYLVNELGMAVLAPNVRGSAGYGKTYLQLDNGMLREDSVKDIGAALDWIATQDDLDADNVIVYGGSYGGYMVLASMMKYDDRLAGGVNIVGISSFVTFLENTSPYRQDLRRAEYGDERDPEMRAFLEEISPLNNADRITKPLFIIQGLNDPRVPASEAEQMLSAVRANGGTVWYLLAKDEGHGFRKKANRDYMVETVSLFLRDVLDLDQE